VCVLVGQKQESSSKLAGSTERLGNCKRGWSVAVVVAATEAVRLRFTLSWAPSEAGNDEASGMSSSGSEMRSTSMITGDALSNIDVSVGLGLLADAGDLELSDSAGRFAIERDDVKKESILG